MENAKKPRSPRKSAPAAPSPPATSTVWPAHEWPFVREILADPFEDAPRLVFADWLEERGDHRAEFIRLECALANMRVRDPDYAEFSARADLLIERHGEAWLERYPKLPGVVWGIDGVLCWNFEGKGRPHYFSRGLPEAVHLKKMIGGLARRAELLVDELGFREVHVSLESKRDVRMWAGLPQLARLGALVLTGEANLEPLLASPNLGPLGRLDVSDLKDVGTGLRAFLDGPNSHRLRWLKMRRVERPKDLQSILEWKDIDQIDSLAMVPDAWGESLDLIAASRMRLSQLQFNTPASAANEVLELSTRLFKSPALSEATLLRIKNLPPKMGVFERIRLPPRVTTLILSGQFADSDVAAIARGDSFGQLRRLSMEGEWFNVLLGDGAARALAGASSLAKLETLELAYSRIGDQGAEALVRSEALAGLKRLNLQGSAVSEGQKVVLKQMFRGKLEI